MTTANSLTDAEIERRLTAARDAEKRARARVARLRRAVRTASRRLEAQRKCALGGVLLALAARGTDADARLVAYVRSYLVQHPPHDSNHDALRGTPFALDAMEPSHG